MHTTQPRLWTLTCTLWALALLMTAVGFGCGGNDSSDSQQSPKDSSGQDQVGFETVTPPLDAVVVPDLVTPKDQTVPVNEFSIKKLQQRDSSVVCPPIGEDLEPTLQTFENVEVKGAIVVSEAHALSGENLVQFYVGDADGGPWSGIAVVMTLGQFQVARGDQLDLKGELQEAGCFTRIKVSELTVVAKGVALPTPEVVGCEELVDRSVAEAYEGTLVKVFGVYVDKSQPSFGQLTMTEGCIVDDDFKPFTDGLPSKDTAFNWVVGLLTYRFSAFMIEPRDAADLNVKSGPGQDVVTPDATDTETPDGQIDAESDTTDTIPSADSDAGPGTDSEDTLAVDSSDVPVVPDVEDSVTPPDTSDVTVPDDVADTSVGPDASDTIQADTTVPSTQTCQFNTAKINEILYDAPGQDYDDGNRFSFIELAGPPNATLPSVGISMLRFYNGTISTIDGDNKPSPPTFTLPLGLQSFGANGLLLIIDSNHSYSPAVIDAHTNVLYLCTKPQCDGQEPMNGCTCVQEGARVITMSGGAKDSEHLYLQNGPECVTIESALGVVMDIICYTRHDQNGTWSTIPETWTGFPNWSQIVQLGKSGELPHQDSPDSATGRLTCTDAPDLKHFQYTNPTPGKYNAQLVK